MFQIETISDLDSLLADRETWNSLTRGVPFRDAAWLGPWWRNLGQQRKAHAVVARDETGEIRGILPLYFSDQSIGNRTLSILGDGEACSDYVSVLAREADAIEVARQFAEYLIQTVSDSRIGWDVIDIDGVVEGDQPMTVLANCLREGGAAIHAQSCMSTWLRPAAQSWDDHLKAHGKSQRRKMRGLCKALGNNDSLVQWSAETVEETDRLLDTLMELHQRRWTDAGELGSYADPAFCQFVRESAIQFLDRGNLYLTALERDGTVIGTELNIIGDNRVLYSFSSGFDLNHSDVEPGRVLGVDTLQHMYRDGLAGIDYMRGDETYKQRFATESRRVLRLRAVAPAWLPKLRQAIWNTQFEFKQLVRRHTGRELFVVMDLTQPAV